MEKLGITEIAGICRADNYASRRVLEKCGFRLEFDSLATAPPQKKLYHGEPDDIRVYRYVAEQITYSDKLCDVSADDLKGFFVGWRSPLTSEQHYDILRGSTHFAVALNSDGRVVGFITALCDGVNSAFIPLLEVLPEYQHRGIGSKLLRLMLTKLDGIPSIDLTCDPEMQPFYERFKMLRSTGMILRKNLD
jgi:ribosomal protein S18 acetylase RimI-like enzyme